MRGARPVEVLMIFAKVPRAGSCKTRLGAAIGYERAARLAEAFLEATLQDALPAPAARAVELHFAPAQELRRAGELAGGRVATVPQVDGDLGRRMAAGFARAFGAGAERVLCIGTDSPQLGRVRVDRAFELLAKYPVVLGPAEDGGYYAIGLSAERGALFEGMAWSTSSVFASTLERCLELGLDVARLEELYDVDGLPELLRLADDLDSAGRHPELAALSRGATRGGKRR